MEHAPPSLGLAILPTVVYRLPNFTVYRSVGSHRACGSPVLVSLLSSSTGLCHCNLVPEQFQSGSHTSSFLFLVDSSRPLHLHSAAGPLSSFPTTTTWHGRSLALSEDSPSLKYTTLVTTLIQLIF